MYILEVVKALVTGTVLGAAFSLLRLPIPAPTAFIGIVGILGVWLGYMLTLHIWG